jgi:hypothetical protein
MLSKIMLLSEAMVKAFIILMILFFIGQQNFNKEKTIFFLKA